jgi:hypothetical protein
MRSVTSSPGTASNVSIARKSARGAGLRIPKSAVRRVRYDCINCKPVVAAGRTRAQNARKSAKGC